MVMEVTRAQGEALNRKIPQWNGAVRCCPKGCMRYCVGSSKDAVETWTETIHEQEYRRHRCTDGLIYLH